MKIWNKILDEIKQKNHVAFMCVLDCKGSSPGRQGFKMYVTSDGHLHGSIGGGIMEHKLVELAKDKMSKGPFQPFVKRQIHRSGLEVDKSGMICSGEQLIAFYYIDQSIIGFLNELKAVVDSSREYSLILDQNGCRLGKYLGQTASYHFEMVENHIWQYIEPINNKPRVNILGGGHVGLALSQIMNLLGFYVAIYDNRNKLNTLEANIYSHEQHIVQFENISNVIPAGQDDYVVIMSFGYRTDEVCIKQLLHRNYKYFGVMGSKEKMNTLLHSLLTQGYSQEQVDKIHTPIGIQINSQTPMEIAISVAAEIISVKNLEKSKR